MILTAIVTWEFDINLAISVLMQKKIKNKRVKIEYVVLLLFIKSVYINKIGNKSKQDKRYIRLLQKAKQAHWMKNLNNFASVN